MFLVGDQTNPNNPSQQCLGQKEYSGKVINLVDQVARFSEVGTKYNSESLPRRWPTARRIRAYAW